MNADVPNRFLFYFDPSCPWTWLTARWLVDATSRTGADVEWRNLSLAVVNAGQEVPEEYRAAMEAGERAHRVIAALRAADRNDLVGEFYAEWGRRMHERGEPPTASLATDVADAVGASEWASAADDASWDGDVERTTREGQELAGGGVGSPVLACGEPLAGMFGPIVSPAPEGADAVALLERVAAAIADPTFFELKRTRNDGPQLGPPSGEH